MSITLPFTPELQAGLSAVALCVGADKMTPVINGVQVTAEHLLATDRYVAARFTHGVPLDADTMPVIIHPAALKALSAFKNLTPGLTLTLESGGFTVAYSDGFVLNSFCYSPISGNYPAVHRLFPDFPGSSCKLAQEGQAPALIKFAPKNLAKALNAVLKIDRHGVAEFQFMATDNPNKPGLALVTHKNLSVLVQPNSLAR